MPSPFARPTSPPTRPFRFSTQREHDVRPRSMLHPFTSLSQHSSPQIGSPSSLNRPLSVVRRGGRIPEIIAGGLRRNRTTSLPPRPRSEEGHTDLTLVNGEPDTDSVASSSFASGKHHPHISPVFPRYHSPPWRVHGVPFELLVCLLSSPHRIRFAPCAWYALGRISQTVILTFRA